MIQRLTKAGALARDDIKRDEKREFGREGKGGTESKFK